MNKKQYTNLTLKLILSLLLISFLILGSCSSDEGDAGDVTIGSGSTKTSFVITVNNKDISTNFIIDLKDGDRTFDLPENLLIPGEVSFSKLTLSNGVTLHDFNNGDADLSKTHSLKINANKQIRVKSVIGSEGMEIINTFTLREKITKYIFDIVINDGLVDHIYTIEEDPTVTKTINLQMPPTLVAIPNKISVNNLREVVNGVQYRGTDYYSSDTDNLRSELKDVSQLTPRSGKLYVGIRQIKPGIITYNEYLTIYLNLTRSEFTITAKDGIDSANKKILLGTDYQLNFQLPANFVTPDTVALSGLVSSGEILVDVNNGNSQITTSTTSLKVTDGKVKVKLYRSGEADKTYTITLVENMVNPNFSVAIGSDNYRVKLINNNIFALQLKDDVSIPSSDSFALTDLRTLGGTLKDVNNGDAVLSLTSSLKVVDGRFKVKFTDSNGVETVYTIVLVENLITSRKIYNLVVTISGKDYLVDFSAGSSATIGLPFGANPDPNNETYIKDFIIPRRAVARDDNSTDDRGDQRLINNDYIYSRQLIGGNYSFDIQVFSADGVKTIYSASTRQANRSIILSGSINLLPDPSLYGNYGVISTNFYFNKSVHPGTTAINMGIEKGLPDSNEVILSNFIIPSGATVVDVNNGNRQITKRDGEVVKVLTNSSGARIDLKITAEDTSVVATYTMHLLINNYAKYLKSLVLTIGANDYTPVFTRSSVDISILMTGQTVDRFSYTTTWVATINQVDKTTYNNATIKSVSYVEKDNLIINDRNSPGPYVAVGEGSTIAVKSDTKGRYLKIAYLAETGPGTLAVDEYVIYLVPKP